MRISFLKYKKIYFAFSGGLLALSLFLIVFWGLKPGIDFTGGSILEIEYQETRPLADQVKDELAGFDLAETYVQPTGEKGFIIRMKDISEDTHQQIMAGLEKGGAQELRFESVGPTIGRELKEKTKIIVVLSLLAIVAYIALAFRKLKMPAPSWQYGLAALAALGHDVLIPLGVFVVLGRFYGVQITIPIIVALLTVVGYSINDTVVVFDRIRENLLKRAGKTYQETVDLALNQTLARSLNTSLTTLFVLFAIFFLGGETLKYFSLALIVGIAAGTYSSIFLAGPLLTAWLQWRRKI